MRNHYWKAALLLPLFFLLPMLANAEIPWTGAQTHTVVGGEIPLPASLSIEAESSSPKTEPKNNLSLYGSAHFIWVPETKAASFYSYFGPKWYVEPWFWLAPQFGFAGRATADGKDAGIAGLWSNITILTGQLSFFLESEAYLNEKAHDYSGYYAPDYHPIDWLNIGAHVDQFNTDFKFGPHIGFSKGPWQGEIRYYLGLQRGNKGQTVRFCNFIMF